MKRSRRQIHLWLVALLGVFAVLAMSFSAEAARRVCDDGSYPPCKTVVGESAGNNLSYPVIFSDNAQPSGFVDIGTNWLWRDVVNATECFTGNTGGLPLDSSYPCYYDGTVWWLQERTYNKWQAFHTTDPNLATPVVVTAIDWGDLLESTPGLQVRMIRTEVSLLMDATQDPDFAGYVLSPYPAGGAAFAANTFQAFRMSGAVPGTDQSINEIQGTDFGDGLEPIAGSQLLIDPTGIKFAPTVVDPTLTPGAGARVTLDPPLGFHATVYSNCARFVIQKITDTDNATALRWNPTLGYWVNGANAPVVNIAARTGQYTAEINAGGSMIYGYNWDAKSQGEGEGLYRLTFVIDGPDRCTGSNTVFDLGSASGGVVHGTVIANPGEVGYAVLVPKGDPRLKYGEIQGNEGGLTYIDLTLVGKAGGGGGGGKKPR